MLTYRIAAALIAALLFSTASVAPATAKPGGSKPPKDPPTPPPPLTNPAFVYVAEDDSKPSPYLQLYLTNIDGSVTEQLTFDTYRKMLPEWSPDGAKIAYARAQDDMVQPWCGGIYARNADGTGEEELLFDLCEDPYPLYLWATPSRLPWSPDNRMLIGAQGPVSLDPGIYEIDLATGDVRNIVPSLTPGLLDRAINAAWSPDLDDSTPGYQGEIAVCGSMYSPVWHTTAIYILDPETGALKRTIPGTEYSDGYSCMEGLTQIDWSPDGDWLLFGADYHDDVIEHEYRLLKSRADGTGQPTVLLTSFGFYQTAGWSSDSELFSFAASLEIRKNKVQPDLFYMAADGSGLTNVTGSAQREYDLDWNPVWVNDS
jgi:Tol biopolymer transport system component